MSNTASYIGKEPQYGVFITQTETGDGSTVAFSLDYTAATTASLLVSVGGVVQQPAVAYNLNAAGTTLTFTGAPGSTEPIWILYLGQLLQVPQATSANVSMITGESALGTSPAAGDYFLLYDADAAAMKKVAYSNLETGDISSVVAGTGLSGGGTTGAVTLNVEAAQTQITSLGTIGSLVATTADINGGTFDGIVGGTTPAAVSATTLTATGAFTSLGINDDASSNAITIESDGDVKIGTTDTIGSKLYVYDAGFPAITAERFKTGETSAIRDVLQVILKTDGDAADGFGPAIQFAMTDTGATADGFASIGAVRDGADGNGAIVLRTGAGTEHARLSFAGLWGLGTNSPAKQLHITKSAAADLVALSDATNIAVDFDTGQNFTVTLAGNRTLSNPTNVTAGQTGSIFITQDGTGSRTLSYGTSWEFPAATAPVLTTTAAAVDRIDYIVKSSTSIQAVATLAYA